MKLTIPISRHIYPLITKLYESTFNKNNQNDGFLSLSTTLSYHEFEYMLDRGRLKHVLYYLNDVHIGSASMYFDNYFVFTFSNLYIKSHTQIKGRYFTCWKPVNGVKYDTSNGINWSKVDLTCTRYPILEYKENIYT